MIFIVTRRSIAGAILMAGLALPHAALGQSDPGGARAPDTPRSLATPPGAGYGGPAGASEIAADLAGVWTGTGLQGRSTWTIRLTLGGLQPVIEYPTLNCGGRWEPVSPAKPDTHRFIERITFGLDRCVADGYVTLTVKGASLVYEWSSTDNGRVEARGTLNR